MGASVNVYNLSGGNGGDYVNGAGPHTGDYYAIQFTADSQIVAWTGNITGVPTAETFAKGDVLYGRWTSVTFNAAAKAVLYNG